METRGKAAPLSTNGPILPQIELKMRKAQEFLPRPFLESRGQDLNLRPSGYEGLTLTLVDARGLRFCPVVSHRRLEYLVKLARQG